MRAHNGHRGPIGPCDSVFSAPNQDTASGVSVIFDPKIQSKVLHTEYIEGHAIIIVTLIKDIKSIVCGVYGSSKGDRESAVILNKFVITLRAVATDYPEYQNMIVGGDFNVSISRADTTGTLRKPNTRQVYINMLNEFSLADTAELSTGTPSHTWRGPGFRGRTARLDRIPVSSK